MLDMNKVVDLAIKEARKDIINLLSEMNDKVPLNLDYINDVQLYFMRCHKKAEGSEELGGMENLMEGYRIYIRYDAMMDMIHNEDQWIAHCYESPKEFMNFEDEDTRTLAIIIETMYHELRHTVSVERLEKRGMNYWAEYQNSYKEDGYWNNRFERSARAWQRKCMKTLMKFIENNKVKEI